MSILSVVLIVKISVTLLFIALPMLVLPTERLDKIFNAESDSSRLYRLYGVAMLALVIAYSSGVWQISNGVSPVGVMMMGIMSNGGAVIVAALTKSFLKNLALNLFFAVVTIFFVLGLVSKNFALSPIL